jgi:two-component system, LuxR family, sensor kinase FixL
MGGLDMNELPTIAVDQDSAVKEIKRIDHFAALAEISGDFICLANAHGEPFYLNPAAKRMLGLPESKSAAETKLHDYYAPDSWIQIRDVAVPAVNKIGTWRGCSRLRNAQTNEPREVQTTMIRVRSPEPAGPSTLAIIHRETGDLESLQRSLAEAHARKHAILESSLDPIITIDHEGVITEFNRAAELTFGYSRDKIIGTKPSELLFPPSMDPSHKDRIERYLSAGEGSMLGKRGEAEVVRANGETFSAELAMTISIEQGAPVMSFYVRDISARKKAEAEQTRYAAELERSNQELEQFAYVASHDLQEPLRKIRTFSDRLLLKQAEKLDDDGRECLERMQSAATRMQSLIDGLLTLSRVTTRGQNFEIVDLSQIAAEVVSDLEEQIGQLRALVEVGKLPAIQADPLQMRQLIQNLIGNALKYHREGVPPVVTISAHYLHGPDCRKAGQSPKDEQCRLVVEDNGVGFEDKYADRIFGIFQRLYPRDVYEGTGIGLAICRRIAERHGGTIVAHGVPDQGSTFEVLLPVAHPKRKTDGEDDH